MDGDRRPCNRATCGKTKCSHMNKATNRAPQIPNRPGAMQAPKGPSPFGGNSTQILYVEPNFSETPSEYDIFYDCYSDVDINQQCAITNTKSGSTGHTQGKDSKQFRDALKQVIVTAQTLLVEFDSTGGRRERKGCGSRCRCDVRNIKPHTRTVQLEVTAKVATNKHSPPPNIQIDPITFTIPLKLHLQGKSQQSLPFTPSQQSYEVHRPIGVQDQAQVSGLFNSMEPIRTAIITAPRPDVGSMPMEGPGPAFDFHTTFLQQMTAGFLQFPLPQGAEDFFSPPPPVLAKMDSSRVQIKVPQPPPLITLGSTADVKESKSKTSCGNTCSIGQHQAPSVAPSVDPFITPSLAPVNKGPFLQTIGASSMPSLGTVKSQQLSETGSRGVCVMCGRGGGESTQPPMESPRKGRCIMCSKGKTAKSKERSKEKKGVCGKCTKGAAPQDKKIDENATTSLVVIVPPMPSGGTSPTKGPCKTCSLKKETAEPIAKPEQLRQPSKGPCGMCTRGAAPSPPPLEEPLKKVVGPCGMCSVKGKPLEKKSTVSVTTSTTLPQAAPSKGGCLTCSKSAAPPKPQPSEDIGRCKVCSTKVEAPSRLEKGLCSTCAGKSVPPTPQPSGNFGRCKVCSTKVQAPARLEKGLCSACAGNSIPPTPQPSADFGRCKKCSTKVETSARLEKGLCSTCAGQSVPPTPQPSEDFGRCKKCSAKVEPSARRKKGLCSTCAEKAESAFKIDIPLEAAKRPCKTCSRPVAAPTEISISPSGPMEAKRMICSICKKVSRQPAKVENSPSATSSRVAVAVTPPPAVGKGPCEICSRGGVPPAPSFPDAEIVPCGVCLSIANAPSPGVENRPCGVCSRSAAPAPSPTVEKGPCGMCSRGAASPPHHQPLVEKGPCGICSRGAAPSPAPTVEKGSCGTCLRGAAAPPTPPPTFEKGSCGTCLRGAAAPPPPPPTFEKGPCGICSRDAAAPPPPATTVEKGPCGICSIGAAAPSPQPPTIEKGPCGICSRVAAPLSPPPKVEKGPCGICSRGVAAPPAVEKGPCGICFRPEASPFPPPTVEKGPCGICSRVAASTSPPTAEIGPCGICSRGAAPPFPPPIAEIGPCGICSRGVAPPPQQTIERGPCGICSRAAVPPSMAAVAPCVLSPPVKPEKTPCDICSRGAAPPPREEKGPCGICSRGPIPVNFQGDVFKLKPTKSAPSVMSIRKEPCDICSRIESPKAEPEAKLPCNICKRGPPVPDFSADLCHICKKVRAPEPMPKETPTNKDTCDICSKLTPPGHQAVDITPCRMCGTVGAPCGICTQQQSTNQQVDFSAPSTYNQTCATCGLPTQPKPPENPPCLGPAQPTQQSNTCGTCLTSPPPPQTPVIDNNCSTCLLPKPKEICSCFLAKEVAPKYHKALPQHKDIHICSPCRYDPSPLIDENGKVFCPHNCGCCLCPWRRRATDSQIDQIKHEKIKVCKCRMKGSIFADYTTRAKCSNTSYFDCCPCRERAEAKYLAMFGEEMWSPDDRLNERVRGEPVRMEDVVEYRRANASASVL